MEDFNFAKRSGTIYPGANENKTPFGYMNIRTYTPHPNPKYDIAILKGTERDQDEFYKYYIRKFSTTVKGYTDEEFRAFMGQDAYAYGYPHGKQFRNNVQYRSDGKITSYKTKPIPYLLTDMPFLGNRGRAFSKKMVNFLELWSQEQRRTLQTYSHLLKALQNGLTKMRNNRL